MGGPGGRERTAGLESGHLPKESVLPRQPGQDCSNSAASGQGMWPQITPSQWLQDEPWRMAGSAAGQV